MHHALAHIKTCVYDNVNFYHHLSHILLTKTTLL